MTPIKVIVNSGNKRTSNKNVSVVKEISDDFVMIKSEFLKHLHRSWIKINSEKFSLDATGGFLVKCESSRVSLRVPAKKEIFEIKIDPDIYFYVKNDDPNYLSLLEFEIEKSKVKFVLDNLKEREKKLDQKIKAFEKMQHFLQKK